MKSRWLNNREEAKGQIQRQETARLENETFTRPNTKYAFVSYMSIQCCMLGRTKKGLYALDTFNENLCVFRCLAVQRGGHKKNNLKKNEMHHIPSIARYFNQAIIVYDVSDEGVFGLCGQFTPEEKEEKEEQNRPMTIDRFCAILQCAQTGKQR